MAPTSAPFGIVDLQRTVPQRHGIRAGALRNHTDGALREDRAGAGVDEDARTRVRNDVQPVEADRALGDAGSAGGVLRVAQETPRGGLDVDGPEVDLRARDEALLIAARRAAAPSHQAETGLASRAGRAELSGQDAPVIHRPRAPGVAHHDEPAAVGGRRHVELAKIAAGDAHDEPVGAPDTPVGRGAHMHRFI